MVALAALSTVALMIVSGAVAAPWAATSHHNTHRSRGVGPTGVQLTSYHPPSTFEGYGVDGIDHPLSKRGHPLSKRGNTKRAPPEDAAKSFLQSKLGVSPDGLARHSGHTSDGYSYHYFSQTLNGIPIANAVANVAMKGDKVVSYGSSFVKPMSVAPALPAISAVKAIALAEQSLGGKYNLWPTELKYFAKDTVHVVLTYVIQILNCLTSEWKQAFIDATTGELVNVVDFVADASYHVVPMSYQDPTQKYELVTGPADSIASPDGWHKSGNVSTTETSGNNVVAYKGLDTRQSPVNVPLVACFDGLNTLTTKRTTQSSATNNYKYPYNSKDEPVTEGNVNAARVNAFYIVNSMHDLSYRYGFTETAFNFQKSNYGKGGNESDAVQVSVQDPSGTNNANFATPPDGQSGQMRMFLWTLTTPKRDGALENDIIVHEYTHGISNRLTGGGTGACLQTAEAGGMGEGWSDAMADITECKGSVKDFTLGSYVTNNPAGIRSHPYSTSKDTNPLTYGSLATKNEVHDIGEVWANMLHNVLAALVDAHGFSDNLKDSSSGKGNSVMLHLMMDGFSLQPCNPTFLAARDAIIQADANRYGGQNECLLWKAFASRGLGKGATAETKVDNMAVPDGC